MSFHEYRLNEFYSNADGSIQYVELLVGNANGESFWQGHTLVATQGATTHSFTFPSNLPSTSTANRAVLVATQGFANLGLVTPDFIVPAQFLFLASGSVNFAGVSLFNYASLPTDGTHSLAVGNVVGIGSPKNFSGVTAAVSTSASPPTAAPPCRDSRRRPSSARQTAGPWSRTPPSPMPTASARSRSAPASPPSPSSARSPSPCPRRPPTPAFCRSPAPCSAATPVRLAT